MKHILYTVITVLMVSMAFAGRVSAQRMLVDQVVATVGDESILWSDIESRYQQAVIEGQQYNGDLRGKLLEDMLIQKLMVNQAILDSVEVSDSEVASRTDDQLSYYISQVGGQDKLEEYFGKPFMHLRREMMENMRSQLLTMRMQNAITEKIKITPSEIRKYFSQMSQDSIPNIPAQYEIAQIVLYPEIEQKEVDRIKGRLRDFQKQIAEGKDFATLAVLYSEDNSASRGGDLGWASKQDYVPEFAAAAYNLKDKNKVSKIVETEYGYHIIQLIDRRGDRINCRHILLKPKASAESKQKAQDFLDSITTFINRGQITFEQAALRFSMDKDTRSNGGVMTSRDGSTKHSISDIPAEIAKAISGLKEGEYSKPFHMYDERRSKDTYRIVLLKKRHEPHKANMQQDYAMLQDIMMSKKRSDAVTEWIKNHQKDIYINIAPEWQDTKFEYPGWVH
ncbi:MAG: peptidylprolyl isomerase [Bacteroidales bacterium]|nr:peptidylprolyl isomerase [Bacteroidales bacterium]